MTPRLPPELRAVHEAHQAREEAAAELDRQFTEAVLEARAALYSLAEIGGACGMSLQGVAKAVTRGHKRRLENAAETA